MTADLRYDATERGRLRHAYRERLERLAAAPLGPRVPAVELPMRPPVGPDELAPNARRLATLSVEHGWQGRAFYSRGTAVTPSGQIRGPAEACSVRLARGAERVVATWVRLAGGDWKADDAWCWSAGEWPRKVGVRAVENVVIKDNKPSMSDNGSRPW